MKTRGKPASLAVRGEQETCEKGDSHLFLPVDVAEKKVTVPFFVSSRHGRQQPFDDHGLL
jgi:hypothetical protein